MKKFLNNWNFGKHFILCVMTYFLLVMLTDRLNEPSSMSIIGGAEGPTDIYIAGGIYSPAVSMGVMIAALALYVPVKSLLKRACE